MSARAIDMFARSFPEPPADAPGVAVSECCRAELIRIIRRGLDGTVKDEAYGCAECRKPCDVVVLR